MLFAAADAPWWVSDILLPVASTIVTVLVTLLAISRSESLRRIARWEPFSERLWDARAQLYSQVVNAVRQSYRAGYQLGFMHEESKEQKRALRTEWNAAQATLEPLRVQASILLDSEFNDLLLRFAKHMHGLMHLLEHAKKVEHADGANMRIVDMIDVARRRLGIDHLDQRTRADILAESKEEASSKETETGSN
jgi:hypothetical protein